MPSSNVLIAVVTISVLSALVVPTAAVTLGDDSSSAVQFEPTSAYATIEDGKLTLDIDGINERATTSVDALFEVTVTDEEVEAVWLSHEVDGLTFYADENRDAEIEESNPLDPGVGETTTVGLSIDTREAVSGTETFTIHVEYRDEPDRSSAGSIPETDPDLNVTNATLDRTEVAVGEAFDVTATVEADADDDEPVRGPVALEVDGWLVDSQSVTVEPDESVEVRFTWQLDEPGSYDVGVDDVAAGTVTATEPDDVRSLATRQLSSPLAFAVAPPAALGLLIVVGTANARRRS